MTTILVAEDNLNLRKLMCIHLKRAGYDVLEAADGLQALNTLDHNKADLIIADIMMPNIDGYEMIRELRDANIQTPILVVTAKDTLHDKKVGFRTGADDYMTKPVDMEEMILRVEALLRRCNIESPKNITVGTTKINFESLTIEGDGFEIQLRPKEFFLLEKLIQSPMKIFTRQVLMDDIWGYDSDSDPRTVDAHVKRLRAKLTDITDFEIETVRGFGYRAVIRK